MEFKKKILVVEDEKTTQLAVQATLEKAGFDVYTSDNGQEALKQIQKKKPDLILSDIVMPFMDGFEFYKHVKNDVFTQDIPVIILTAKGKMEDTFHVLGVDSFMVKPFDHDILVDTVNNVLRKESDMYVANKKILIAGSVRSVLDEMVDILRKENSTVQIVEDIAKLHSMLEEFSPDILILEVDMQGSKIDDLVLNARKTSFGDNPILAYQNSFERDYSNYSVVNRMLLHDTVEGIKDFVYIGRYKEDMFIKKIIKCLAVLESQE